MTWRPYRAAGAVVAVVAVASGAPAARPPVAPVAIQLLAFNDLHGHLDPPDGSNGHIAGVTAGGMEYLSTHLARLKARVPNTLIVSAGDNIGASPLLSGLSHDEPTIDALNAAGLDVSSVGNHEFDEGWRELLRMQRGGCHPVDGCFESPPFGGARFRYLAANVEFDAGGKDQSAVCGARTPGDRPDRGHDCAPGQRLGRIAARRSDRRRAARSGPVVSPSSAARMTRRDR